MKTDKNGVRAEMTDKTETAGKQNYVKHDAKDSAEKQWRITNDELQMTNDTKQRIQMNKDNAYNNSEPNPAVEKSLLFAEKILRLCKDLFLQKEFIASNR